MLVQAGNTELPTGILQIAPKIDRDTCMRFLSYAYRISSNFVFLALVYYSLNFLEKYRQRAIVAILVLVYAAMRAASALRSFYFFATSWGAYRGWPRRIGRAQANRQRCCYAASRRRNEVYRSAVSHLDRGALHFQDRDQLNR